MCVIIVIALTVKGITTNCLHQELSMPFYGRARELNLLDKMHAKPGAHLFLLF